MYCSKLFQLCISAITGLACFHPFLYGTNRLQVNNAADLYYALTEGRSQYFRDTSLVALSLMVPLVIDVLFDFVNFISRCWSEGSFYISTMKSAEEENDEYHLSYTERVMIYFGLLIVPIVGMLPKDTKYLPELYICGRYAQLIWAIIPYLLNLVRCRTTTSSPRHISDESTTTLSLVFSIGCICAVRSVGAGVNPIFAIIGKVLISFSVLCFVAIVGISFLWVSAIPGLSAYFSKKLSAGGRKGSNGLGNTFAADKLNNNNNANDVITTDQREYNFFLSLYLFFSTAVQSFVLISAAVTWKFYDTNWFGLFIANMAFITFEMNLLVFQMRRSKFKVLIGLHATIDAKKSYIRYISHELRTPLNAAFLGIKLLSDDFRRTVRTAEEAERLETLTDVSNSCSTAIEILNDLLCFDKIENGLLTLHKSEVNVVDFIACAVSMFNAAAKERGVTIVNETEVVRRAVNASDMDDSGRRPSGRMSILNLNFNGMNQQVGEAIVPQDVAHFDRFKCDQVS